MAGDRGVGAGHDGEEGGAAPGLGTWGRWYALVLGALALEVALLTWFSSAQR